MAAGTVTIANNESLSGAFQSNYAPLVGLSVPTVDSATFSFQVQLDPDDEFRNLYDSSGTEVKLGSASTGARTFALIEALAGVYAFKVRSGTAGSPVAQSPAVDIFIAARTGIEG